ncbi:MAG: ABC transporter ATP-binding protein [Firmicutes bacterium]|nr:ABC transporter ATP-binding protein [Bacillota bacterium]
MTPADVLLEVHGLVKHFPLRRGLRQILRGERPAVRAVDGVSFSVRRGEIVGLVGESGSGKTTTGRVLLRLEEPTSGEIVFDGQEITRLPQAGMTRLRRRMQIVFQDPYDSMNPNMDVFGIVAEPLRIQRLAMDRHELERRVIQALEAVELVPAEHFMRRYPKELSGGQRQRVAIARALVLEPDFLVADEPVSMLDVSIRGGILRILHRLVRERGLALLFITHDLALARHFCDRVAVMYLGQVVELASADTLVQRPHHPYTQALMEAVLSTDPRVKRIRVGLKGEIPNPADPPAGCRLHPRCPLATDRCRTEAPQLIEYEPGHFASCHYVERALERLAEPPVGKNNHKQFSEKNLPNPAGSDRL